MKKNVILIIVVALVAVSQASIIPGDWVVGDTFVAGGRDFTNAYGAWPTEATDYVQDAEYDWNPVNAGAWGVSLDIAVESNPGDNDDGEAGVLHLGDGGWPSLAVETFKGEYTLHIPGSSFNQTGVMANVGGTDHMEITFVDGLWTMEINGTVATTLDWGSGNEFDPKAGLVIGAMNGTSWGQGVVRGIDATIGDLTLYNVPEPISIALFGLGSLIALRRRR